MEKRGIIYKIENLVNGKVYVGQTIQCFDRRKNGHINRLNKKQHGNHHLQSAWNKYGISNFLFNIITRCLIDELDILEMYWINSYNSTNPEFGYNKTSGGNLHKKQSRETLVKMSNITKQLWKNDDFRNAHLRKVICIDTGEIFDSGIEASKKMGVYIKNMYSCCSGNRDSVIARDGKRYQFAHYIEGKEYKLKRLKSSNISRKVILVNTGEMFNGYREASKKTGVHETKIGACCRGQRETAGMMSNGDRMVWVYAEDYEPSKEYSFEHRQKGKNNPMARKVICLTTGEIFGSMSEAGKKYNIKCSCKISEVCRGKRNYTGSLPDGTKLKWAYYE